MKTLKKISGTTCYDRKRKNDIRQKCNIKVIVKWFQALNENIDRMKLNRPVEIKRDCKLNRRSIGGPQKQWRLMGIYM